MRLPSALRAAPRAARLAASLALAACSPSGGSPPSFAVLAVSVQDGQIWQLNRPIQIAFSAPVDFGTVGLATIQVRELGGAPASGTFFLADPRTVVFQPTCPTLPDHSDGALLPARSYELTILGSDQGLGSGVLSQSGANLAVSVHRTFVTPDSTVPAELFFDPVPGPPRPIVRGRDGVPLTELDACYVELGGNPDPAARLYFEDTGAGVVLRAPDGSLAALPLNFKSDASAAVAAVLLLDQPVDPASADPALGAVRWEYEATAANWQPVSSRFQLLANCTATGSVLRVEPIGLLPPATRARLVVTPGLADITGDGNLANLDDFALAPTALAPVPLADEIYEGFTISAADDPLATLHDFTALLPDPPASWESGRLAPGFDFDGTGGPGGNFDVRIPAGQSVTWSTLQTLLVGGPDFTPSSQVVALGGVFDVDDLRIEPGATLKITGPNPARILATGRVEILGTLDASGSSNLGVAVLNTTNVPELGAPGQCGGGSGGTGSPLTTTSSPMGGAGFGAFEVPDLGGGGGETGWNCLTPPTDRRGGGGGGGVFGHDALVGGVPDESRIGLNAEPGFPGSPKANGAVGGVGVQPQGGVLGPGPFQDSDPANDFFGQAIDPVTGTLVIGELPGPWAGSGGGGGGDAAPLGAGEPCQFPSSNFTPQSDEKGAGGGGGGGSLSILALGPVMWGSAGQVRARGGHGGPGENSPTISRIGAGSGGGSGGHVLIESALAIDLSQKGPFDVPAILATGGQGGDGAANQGGAGLSGESPPDKDGCPDTSVPGCIVGPVTGAGGDGGPGIVQLHSPTGTVGPGGDIILAGGLTLADVCAPPPLPPLLPRFGRTSRARSKWIPLGLGGFDASAPSVFHDPLFRFAGTDPATGAILVSGESVADLPSLLPENPPPLLAQAPALPFVAADGYTLVVAAATVPPELLTNPSLLRDYLMDFDAAGTPPGTSRSRFEVASAWYDAQSGTLHLVAPMSGPPIDSVVTPGSADVRLRPAYFRVDTSGVADRLTSNALVQVQLQAAPADPATGQPDQAAASAWTFDASTLAVPGADWRFVRFEVFFDVDVAGAGITPALPRPSLRFLRVPFRY